MQVYQCSNCDFKSIKEEYYCPTCRSQEFHSVTVSNYGTVYSHTTIHTAPPEFAGLAPYHVVLIRMADNLKVTGLMTEPVEIGDQVKLQHIKDEAFVFDLAL
ncbi:Zn-ribbon domain-containing OB-fold protein [Oceanobacillus sp. AG]|uniref:Zn-ribbon domain-containing OB-fold protein n=1 Tax=Oceanobacillus sp. AG TaxID=2681969 RepID=UPI0012EC1766|nr:OB-fold domain-containing protein [Oceanobacillus sp. AG]